LRSRKPRAQVWLRPAGFLLPLEHFGRAFGTSAPSAWDSLSDSLCSYTNKAVLCYGLFCLLGTWNKSQSAKAGFCPDELQPHAAAGAVRLHSAGQEKPFKERDPFGAGKGGRGLIPVRRSARPCLLPQPPGLASTRGREREAVVASEDAGREREARAGCPQLGHAPQRRAAGAGISRSVCVAVFIRAIVRIWPIIPAVEGSWPGSRVPGSLWSLRGRNVGPF